MKSGICYVLYKKYILCELTSTNFNDCQPKFDAWYNFCFFSAESTKIREKDIGEK